MVDEWTRESLAIDIAVSIRSGHLTNSRRTKRGTKFQSSERPFSRNEWSEEPGQVTSTGMRVLVSKEHDLPLNRRRRCAVEVFKWLETWYAQQRDGEWEHSFGVTINTLDNPGWEVVIDLGPSQIDKAKKERVICSIGEPPGAENQNEGGIAWMVCEIKASQFRGAGDPSKLTTILETFRDWTLSAL